MSRPSLAVLGDPPAFPTLVHVGRPNIGDRERLIARINDVLDRRWLSNNGPLVQEFERRIADYVQVKHVICVCNATIGLEIMARAAELRGEVIVPAYTFVATAHALQWQGITPVFADMDPGTHNIDPARVERHITPRTTAILATHVWGRACDVTALEEIARRHNLRLMFDAAHAFGCSHNGRMIGGFGLAEVFSFHATKFLNSFEGGAICTNDDALARRIRLMTNFGFAGFDNVVHIGTNGKMTEVCAAMGITSLEGIDDLISTNRQNHEVYRKNLDGLPGIQIIDYPSSEKCNYQYVVLEVDATHAGLSRDDLVQVLHAENVLARKYFWPGAHRMAPYNQLFPHASLLLPETERVASRIIVLPTGTAMDSISIARISAVIRDALGACEEVRKALDAINTKRSQ